MNTASKEDTLKERHSQRKPTSKKDSPKGRQPQRKMASQDADLTGTEPQKENISSQEGELSGRQTYRKMKTLPINS